jgi:microcystin-dependent protein
MSRVQIPLEVQSPANGAVIAGATVTVTQHVIGGTPGAGAPVPYIYLAETGAGNAGSNAVTTDSLGRVTQGAGAGFAAYWLPVGTYDFAVSGSGLTSYVITREMVSAQGSDPLSHVGELLFGVWLTLPSGTLWASGPGYTQNVSRATYALLFSAICLQTTGTLNGTVTVSAVPAGAFTALAQIGPNAGIAIPISGTNIPAACTITGWNSGAQTLTLSAAATGSGAGVALVIAPNGVGDGSTTFGLPNLSQAQPMGQAVAAGGAIAGTVQLGGTGGSSAFTITSANMPSHTHSVPALSGSSLSLSGISLSGLTLSGLTASCSPASTGITATQEPHWHYLYNWINGAASGGSPPSSVVVGGSPWGLNVGIDYYGAATVYQYSSFSGVTSTPLPDNPPAVYVSDPGHTHTITVSGTISGGSVSGGSISGSTSTGTTGSAGTGTAVSSVDPFVTGNWVIRTGIQ